MQRLTDFADADHLTLSLAYYPPHHSKYNPIERVWGVLEQHWNGSLLDNLTTELALAVCRKERLAVQKPGFWTSAEVVLPQK